MRPYLRTDGSLTNEEWHARTWPYLIYCLQMHRQGIQPLPFPSWWKRRQDEQQAELLGSG